LNFNENTLTAYRYFFNYSNVQHFEKSKLTVDCEVDARNLVSNEVGSISTVKKDIDCFLNVYAKKFKAISTSTKQININEDHFTSPLSELNLVQDNGGGFYVSDLTERPDLPIAIFVYALVEFVKKETEYSNITSVDFDSLLSKPCSPGRIFRLSESGLGQKLDEAEQYTDNAVSWIDSLGLRQIKVDKSELDYPFKSLDKYYGEQ